MALVLVTTMTVSFTSPALRLHRVMGRIHCNFLLGLLLSCFLSDSLAMASNNITTDQSSLLALRAHISVDPQQILAKNWSVSSSVCDWIGVTCGFHHCRVTALDISNMGLTGILPSQLGNLSFLISLNMSMNNFHGELPNELAWLHRLKVLDLGLNDLTGEIPEWSSSFPKLQYLSLRNNSFTGLIPPSISNMSDLRSLYLSNNSLEGNIPEEIFNISSLEMISLGGNRLSGSLPIYMCGNLPRLRVIRLSKNELSGPIPSSLVQCSELQAVSFSFNKFSGTIPKEIGKLKKLEVIYFSMNKLVGEIPKELGNSTMLKFLDLADNHLTGVIPREIGNLYNLETLSLGWNNLTGSIPVEIFNLSRVTLMSLAGNQLSGNLPSTVFYGLPNLEQLYLNSNHIVGDLPESITNSSKLLVVTVSDNFFTGHIPISLGNLRLLQVLDLGSNKLVTDFSHPETSFISSLANSKNLRTLAVNDNPLNGILPESVGNLSSSLERLYAYRCNLQGKVPDGIGNLSSLFILSLYGNQLTGPLPITIQRLQNLQAIVLYMNKLNQVSLDYFCTFTKLGAIILGQNQISGAVPDCLENVTSLRYLYLNSNRLKSSIPRTLWNLTDLLLLDLSSNSLTGSLPLEMQNLKAATGLILSLNNLSGGIPSTIGDMQSLDHLSLAHNQLEGSIPKSIGSILSLETVDLSHNFFSGSIPKSLENLKYLTSFNVSFNNLSGEIPPNGPFANFTSESFISNKALCGAPRLHVPPSVSFSAKTSGNKKKFVIIFSTAGVITVLGAMSLGFVYLRYRRKGKSPIEADMFTQERISFYKLSQATDNYDERNFLGKGSFGSVYKGTLDDGRVVAVKVFDLQSEGALMSFGAECEALRNLRHRNLTKVISSCSNPDFKALVLEFMPNGNLEKWLYSSDSSLDIIKRLDILVDVASALQYLHYECATPVVHCDLKPSNVLLDEDMVAHVSDFGLTKLLAPEESIVYTKTLATFCYLAPEYGSEGIVSPKCDVYSFGIMVMEVFTRMNPNNEMFGETLSLRSWVVDSMANTLARIVDANLVSTTDRHYLEKLECISSIMKLALNCTKKSPAERSNIRDAPVALKKIKIQLVQYV
ncbi:receptor kinase-like protein Xa21 [Coffea eugenioides]|uniref:receptor kinase-like protein Xa21 n=1 Tax=Coffea eugenioides TaxID=49369 RepID=UPI000F614F9F|nr:receptor kinase-like protein Xa21 [Coffea eugenioides]